MSTKWLRATDALRNLAAWRSVTPACRVALAAMLLVSLAAQAETVKRSELDGLLSSCDSQRQAKLKPHRDAKVAECIDDGKQREYCQQYYADYGERMHRRGPGSTVGAFWNIPICEKAIAAERYFGMNPGKKTFS